jgi:hypothetical protein
MGIGWKGVRFGLTLNRLGSKVIGIIFLLQAAISLALAPWVVGRELHGIVGFALAIIIAFVFLGVVRYAVITQSDEMVIQIVFVIFSVVVCQLVYAHPETLERILVAMTKITPPVLLGSCALFLVGSFYSVTIFGGLFRWLFSAAALVALLGATALTLEVKIQAS